MANYRQVHVHMWKDDWFLNLDPQEKLLFIYLFTNDLASLCGIYKISLRVVEFETGLSKEFIAATLAKFETDQRVYYQDGYIWVKKLRKYHETRSPKVQACIKADLARIPETALKSLYIGYYAGDDTVSIGYGYDDLKEKKREEKKREEKIDSAAGEVYTVFENNISLMTPMLSAKIDDALKDYPPAWIKDAITEAVAHNARNWSYIAAILKRWKAEGRGDLRKSEEQPVDAGKRETFR